MHQLLLTIHILSVTVWVGGHLILALRFLPKALKEGNHHVILNFEKLYEPIGIPALLITVITGFLLAYQYNVTISTWFSFSSSIEKVVSIKLILLIATLVMAIHARFFIIPKLSKSNLNQLAWHIVLLTLTACTMLVLGTFVRMGGL
ncbi:MAG TPA: copper resistance protein CopD [Bacteroidia bacterium]|nr:copper resistance protein CopD [Bacteroidia bacterium]